MAFKIVDLMVDLLPQGEARFAGEGGGCTGASCRAAGTKEGPRERRPVAASELALLRDQLRLLQA
jgi:hypothetical protein